MVKFVRGCALLFISLTIFCSAQVYAGVMELSASYGTRNSKIDEDNYSTSESWTGSFAWYFLELSAIELSYTKGLAEQSLKAGTDPAPTKYYQEAEIIGADLVLTFAGRDSFFQPFIRGGGAHLQKKLFRELPDGTVDQFGETIKSVVPSYGAGFKVNITKSLSLKASYDRWKSGSDDNKIFDDAVKVGISFYF